MPLGPSQGEGKPPKLFRRTPSSRSELLFSSTSSTITSSTIATIATTATSSTEDRGRDVEKALPPVEPRPSDDSDTSRSSSPAETYTAFTNRQRMCIAIMATIVGLVSPLSASLYIPAIPQVAEDLDVSTGKINFTITSYLIFQGITPTLWSSIGDSIGRRPLYLICLTIYVGACAGLSVIETYVGVVVLRALQATGSASAIALGAGVLSDLVHVSERGGFMGSYSALGGLSTAFGPVLGGILADYAGWHSIFYFLLGLSGTMLLLIIFLFPETHRAHVGDGTRPTKRYLQPIFQFLRPKEVRQSEKTVRGKNIRVKFDVIGPLKLICDPEALLCVLFPGLCFAVWQMHIVATSSLYTSEYGLTEMQVGLTYIANGFGALVGSVSMGYILDYAYKKQLARENREREEGEQLEEVQNIEEARLMNILYPTALFIASTISFGWAIRAHAHIAVPIFLSFLLGTFNTYILATYSTLIVDLFSSRSFGATALMNLSRCLISAAGIAAIEPLYTAVGIGWAFTIMGAICLCAYPLVIVERRMGPRWRRKREEKCGVDGGI